MRSYEGIGHLRRDRRQQMRRGLLGIGLGSMLGLLGEPSLGAPEAAPGSDIGSYCEGLAATAPGAKSAASENSISLCAAIGQALESNPALAAFRIEREVGNARLQQAGMAPNPSLDASLENFAGNGPLRRLDSAEASLLYSHTIERGEKRTRREELARAEIELTSIAARRARADVIRDVTQVFVEALTSDEELSLSERRRTLAQEFVATAKRRFAAGRGSSVEEIKARIALSNSEIRFEQAQRNSAAAQLKLGRLVGQPSVAVAPAGNLDQLLSLPPWAVLEAALKGNPELRQVQVEASRRRATIQLEQARAVSDFTVSGGLRHVREAKAVGAIVGFSMPVPIYDRNQGAILAAQKSLAANEFEGRAAVLSAETALRDAYQLMVGDIERARRLKADVIPAAEKGLAATDQAYRVGKLNYLDVLDAQRTLFDAREEYIRAVASYHLARAVAERQIGQGFGLLTSAE